MKEQQFEYHISWHAEPSARSDVETYLKRSIDRHVNELAAIGWHLHSIVPDGLGRFMIVMERKSEVKR